MKKFFLKKFHQVVSFGDKLIIANKNGEISIRNNISNKEILSRLAKQGIAEKDLKKTPFFDDLLQINALEFSEQPNELRNELFFQYLGMEPLGESKSKNILVFGGGGGGATLVYLLGQFGFTNITVVDFDMVEKSDVEKTLVYDMQHIGRQKTEVLKEKLSDNFGIHLKTIESKVRNCEDLMNIISIASPALVINAIDPGPAHKLNLNKVCFEKEIPFIYMAYSYDQLLIGPFLIPGLTDCYISYDNEIKQSKDTELGLSAFHRLDLEGLYHPSISFNINTLASIVLKEIIFFFYQEYHKISSLNRLVTMSLIKMDGVSLEMVCEDDCTCKRLQQKTKQIKYEKIT
ncbi:ThiF family adenylyltransferase [Olivibacter jilunii]|uniref:ThiF family adenylyltransferase n=1 Tax=Olivibacter jilunii TaxID=985016 RepID=UPI003F191681